MPNALAAETSPYLRQHASNPVDWLPWGTQAFERARAEGKPLLVSIGYSACHWCHVMEHESFADERTAAVMNESFVCVKVDREERPDVDALYMEAVQALTGHGGWPLHVFLTPEQLPFYGGTYFPPDPRHGMPAWTQVLQTIAEAWASSSEEIRAGGERLRERLAGGALLRPSRRALDRALLDRAVGRLREAYDPHNGGFGRAPKFPQAPVLELLLLRAAARHAPATLTPADPADAAVALDAPATVDAAGPGEESGAFAAEAEGDMALSTLRSMCRGGIYDQLAGGFHRYSVDATWTVPHFEKMLYDNALLARAYLHGWQRSGEARLAEVCRQTLDWALREMGSPEGGFYSALDADSEGVEGRYYVWTIPQLRQILAEDADVAVRWLGATGEGNFADPHAPAPGLNVLMDRGPRPDDATCATIRGRLLAARDARTRPARDEKQIASWNALMIAALAEAGSQLPEPRYLQAASRCTDFVLQRMRSGDGRLLRTYKDSHAKIVAYLEDYAFLLEALICLFEATCEERRLMQARELADQLIERFSDGENGGFFSTATGGEQLIVRRKEIEDSPIPAGASSAATGLLRLAQLTGEDRYQQLSLGAIKLVQEIAPEHPLSFAHALQAMHWHLAPMRPLACRLPEQPPSSVNLRRAPSVP
jgi:uncharacterized protein